MRVVIPHHTPLKPQPATAVINRTAAAKKAAARVDPIKKRKRRAPMKIPSHTKTNAPIGCSTATKGMTPATRATILVSAVKSFGSEGRAERRTAFSGF